MTPIRHSHLSFLLASAVLGAPLAPAQEEPEVSTETAEAPAASGNLADTLDPTLDLPLASDLPAEPKPEPVVTAQPSANVAINLINLLVQKGTITRAEADEMIKQAEADAAAAQRAQAEADVASLPPEPTPEEELRVTYIPDVVRDQMRDQIQQELMAQAREEKWGEANPSEEWTSKIRPFGDLRLRTESTYFDDGNDNTGAFPNFNRINQLVPFDTSGTQFSPQHNVDEDRFRTRIRARFGADVDLGDGLTGGLRIATGDSSSPTSTNQTFGGGNGSFSKYDVYLDRAFVSYDAGPGDGQELIFTGGRFDNPFFTTDLLYDNDIGFDGLAMKGKVRINDCTNTFFSAGYFPIFNTDFNFASNQPDKFSSTDKYLGGIQWGVEWKPLEDLSAKFAISYHDYSRIQGKLSSPFIPLTSTDAGDTDSTRPLFAQRGNTYFPIRNIDNSTAANDFGNKFQYQYYGLASDFEELAATARVDYDKFEPIRLSLVGEYVQNLAFDKSAIDAVAVNNRGPTSTAKPIGAFEGGDTAWNIMFLIGNPALEKFGDWQASIGYRYVESDAVVDAFTDSDFGGGGTNLKGYTLGARMALTKSMSAGIRWMSANEITGPPLASDILELNLETEF